MCAIVLATSNVSCAFDDMDICGYRDLSAAGNYWLQIHNSGQPASHCMYGYAHGIKITRKRAIAKALHLKGHSDFAPVDLAYYQHFLGFLFENIAFWEVPRGNHKCRSRDATPLVNNK